MASNFVKIGRGDGGSFVPKDLKGQYVIDKSGVSVEQHHSNTTIHLSTEQIALIANAIQAAEKGAANGIATLGADGKIPAEQIDADRITTSIKVNTYDELLALTTQNAPISRSVFVIDATGDNTVENGWAVYLRVADAGDSSDYVKLAEGESLDINFPELEQGIAEAKAEAELLDVAYCTSEADMQSKNLRPGAVVFMADDND